MKKFLSILISIITISGVFTTAVRANNANEVSIVIDNVSLDSDVAPQIINDRTMVPVRAIFEAIGAIVEWDSSTSTATITKDTNIVKITVDSTEMYVNGNSITLDSPACIVNSRTLVPVRAISEALNLGVIWNDETRTVEIYTPPTVDEEQIFERAKEFVTIPTGEQITHTTEVYYQEQLMEFVAEFTFFESEKEIGTLRWCLESDQFLGGY